MSQSLSAEDEFANSSLRKLPYWALTLLLLVLHFATASFDHLLVSGGGRAILVIPESGLDLVAVALFGPRCWPILLPAYFATALWLHLPWGVSIGVAVTSVLQCLAAGWVFRLIAGMKKLLGEFVDLIGIGVAGTVTPVVSTGLGTVCLFLARRSSNAPWGTILIRWWLAETLGILTLAPILLSLARLGISKAHTFRPLLFVKFLSYIVCVSVICDYVFFQSKWSGWLYAVFALILIAAAWLGPAGARLSALMVVLAAVWATHLGLGTFVGGSFRADIQNLDLFVAAVSLMGLVLGAFCSAGHLGLPGTVLLAGWAVSGWLYASLDRDRVIYDEARFDKVITSVETRISNRFDTYEEALWGAAGFVAGSHEISPKNWHIYVDRMRILERYPGTGTISIIQPVPDKDLNTFVQVHRRGEWPDFTLRSVPWLRSAPGSWGEHFLIVCAEPPAVAKRAIGGDLAGDPARRAAAERSRDSGEAILTRSIIMGGASANTGGAFGKGLQLFVPVYREGASRTTIAERRAALIAWVTVVFDAEPFFKSALAELAPMLGLGVYEGDSPNPNEQFFVSGTGLPGGPQAERINHLTLGGSRWTLSWRRLPSFPFLSRTPSAWAAGCSALLSLLLASLVMTLQSTKKRASLLAAEQTAELKASEARKTAIMDSALDPMITIDCTGLVMEFNPAAEKTFGHSREEVFGRELAEIIIPPEFREAHRRGLAQVLATGQENVVGRRIETMALRSDGTVFPVELAVSRVNHEGLPIFTAYLRDLSERKRTEERLNILSSAVEQSPLSVMITDLESRIEYVNARLTETTGYTLEDLKGKTPAMLVAKDVSPDHFRQVHEALQNGYWRGITHSQRKNGEVYWEAVSIRSICDKSGKPTHRVAVAEDITSRLEMEQEIAKLAAIVESAEAAIISKNLDDRVITWNRGAERMYGYTAEEILGQSMAGVIPPDRIEEDEVIRQKVLRGESVSHLETTRITKSGHLIHVLLTMSPIRDREGRVVGIGIVAWDVSQVKELERQLAQAQKLESIGQLAAGIAHEINTPIQYIGDNARFLEDSFRDLVRFATERREPRDPLQREQNVVAPAPADQIEEGVLDYLQNEVPKAIAQLIEGIEQVAHIVRAMKEFSHPGPVEKLPVDINRSIQSTIIVSRNEWKYFADITTDLHSDLPPVPCVAGELNQVILNLIVNAAHAIADVVKDSGRKGSIHIQTRPIDSAVEIRISDSGSGIPQAIRAKVFDPFFTTKPVGKGTGQGLAIAHSVIVQKHKGVLTFESESGRGTTFIIQLPLVGELTAA